MRRTVRIAGWTAAALLALLVLLAGVVLVTPNTTVGRRLIEHWTPRLTSGRVRISGLAGSFPGTIDIGRLDLSDARGVWLSADRISLEWSPLELIEWRVRIERLTIARLNVRRPPERPARRGRRKALSPHRAWPTPHMDVAHFAIGTLVLEPAVAGTLASLEVSGSAHVKSFRRARAHVSAHRTNGEGDYELHLRLEPSSVNASLRLEEPASGPLEHLAGLPGLGALSVVASVTGPRSAERIRLDAHVGALHAKVRGTVDLPRRSADLSYSADSPRVAPRRGLSWQRFRLEGHWHGTLAAAQGSGRLRVDGLKLPAGVQLSSLAANLSATRGVLELRAIAGGLVLPRPTSALFASSPVRLDATLHVDEPRRPLDVSVRHPLVTMTARGPTTGARSATFEIRVPDVKPFGALTHLNRIAGGMTASGTLSEHGASTGLHLSVSTNFAGQGLLARFLGGTSRLRLAARWTSKALDVSQLSLSGAALSLSGSGRASRAAPRAWRIERARWELHLPNLTSVFAHLSGSVTLTGTAAGPLETLATEIRAHALLAARGQAPGMINARLELRGLPPELTGRLRMNGVLEGAPLAVDASVLRGRRRLRQLIIRTAAWKSVRVGANVTSGPHLSSATGKVDLRIARLADLAPFIGRSIAGHVAGRAMLNSPAGRTLARLDVTAHVLAGNGHTTDVRLSGYGPVAALPLALEARLAALRGHPLSLKAQLEADAPTREVTFQTMVAHYRGAALRLLAPAHVSLAKGLRMSTARLGIRHAVLTLSGEWAPTLALKATLTHLDAKVINVLQPGLFTAGTVSASAQLTGALRAPKGRLTVTAAAVRMAGSAAEDLPALDFHGTAQLSDHDARIDAMLHAGTASSIVARGRVPLSRAGRYAVKLSGRLQAALANPLLEAHGAHASGTVAVDATVNGPGTGPQIGGSLTLEHGDLRDYANGVHLGDVTARLVGGRGVLRIVRFDARAGPGRLSLQGTVGILEPLVPIDLELKATNAEPVESDFIRANLNADLLLRGTLRKRLDVTGKIHVNRAHIGIPNGLPPDVAVLDVRRPGETPPTPPARRLTIGLGLKLEAPRSIVVQGRGLNAELGGSLTIDGTTQDAQVHGGFQMIRGRLSLASTQLNFSTGEVTFNGAGLRHTIDPSLDFVAKATASNATVTLRVSGFADAPKFELSSTPPLPQDEILARLLFGESASQLSALQVAEIGAAIASMSGVGGGNSLNPLAALQRALGLNQLTVGSATNGTTQHTGASITAGRYISSRVFVAATQNTTGTSQLKVDVQLTKHFKLQTRLGNGTATAQGTTPENDPGSSIGLSYEFNY